MVYVVVKVVLGGYLTKHVWDLNIACFLHEIQKRKDCWLALQVMNVLLPFGFKTKDPVHWSTGI